MISKELLSKVLPKYITPETSGTFTSEEGFDGIEFKSSFVDALGNKGLHSEIINIYELAHKCKEWAMGQEVQVNSNNSNQCIIFGIGYSFKESFSADTEPEAIFKACQWILDQSKNTKE